MNTTRTLLVSLAGVSLLAACGTEETVVDEFDDRVIQVEEMVNEIIEEAPPVTEPLEVPEPDADSFDVEASIEVDEDEALAILREALAEEGLSAFEGAMVLEYNCPNGDPYWISDIGFSTTGPEGPFDPSVNTQGEWTIEDICGEDAWD